MSKLMGAARLTGANGEERLSLMWMCSSEFCHRGPRAAHSPAGALGTELSAQFVPQWLSYNIWLF